MFTVTCPKCNALLRLPREAHNARLRCRGCGSVFVGSTRQTPDAAASPPPRPAAPPPAPLVPAAARQQIPQVIRRSRTPKWPGILAIICGLGAVTAIALSVYLYGHPYYEERDDDGRLIFAGRLSSEEVARRTQALERKKERPPPPPPDVPGPTPPPRPGGTEAHKSLAGTGELVEKTAAGDTNISVTGTTVIDAGGAGILLGIARNNYTVPVKSLEVSIQLFDMSGNRHGAPTVTCYYIPAGGSVHFSRPVGISRDQVKDIAAVKVSNVTKADEKTVCFEVDTRSVQRSEEENTLVLRGTTRNTTEHGVKDAFIYCDVYDAAWVHQGSSDKGELTEGKNLAPGKSSAFVVRIEPEIVRNCMNYTLRVVGTRAD